MYSPDNRYGITLIEESFLSILTDLGKIDIKYRDVVIWKSIVVEFGINIYIYLFLKLSKKSC